MEEYRKAYDKAKRKEGTLRKAGQGETRQAKDLVRGKTPKGHLQGELAQASISWMNVLREIFSKSMIRRTVNSKDYLGRPISGLDPYQEHALILTPNEAEAECHEKLAEAIDNEEGSKLEVSTVEWARRKRRAAPTRCRARAAFYLFHRQAGLHSALSKQPEYHWPRNEPYHEHRSSKIDAMLRIIQYHQTAPGLPPLTVTEEEGSNELVPNPRYGPLDPAHPDRIHHIAQDPALGDDRIVVFLAFPKNNWVVRKALEENGIKFVEIHGQRTLKQRVKDLHTFKTSPDVRVLLLSQVGTVGLNVAFANILITMDTLWSAQEDAQLIGRLWRHPQKKIVINYRTILNDTPDVFVNTICRDKALLHEAFVARVTDISTLMLDHYLCRFITNMIICRETIC
ncbi:P-loop containing nucleoside triphosphate hydrolase protein [Cerioporus squamosus]|nr:P-loop containing nucleoside triphosphate hydrolase protein [Cerioporus squamosus]